MGPASQVKAGGGTGTNRRRRAFRACTARLTTNPLNQPAATPSHGPAKYVTTPAATPMPHAASSRPLNRFASCQPERAAVATPPSGPRQALPTATSPTLTPSHARRHRLFRGSGGVAVLSAGVVGGIVRRAPSRSALLSTSARRDCIVSFTAWPTA